MQNAIVIKGHLTGPRTVDLEEPVPNIGSEVDVILPVGNRPIPDESQSTVSFLRSLPDGGRTKEDIDRQLREERDAWSDRQ